jgi:peptidoglycan biosynthesis protein MviN/MurJ (putative lipid II flippase)
VLMGFYAQRFAAQGISAIRRPFADLTRACAWLGCLMALGVWLTSDLLISVVYRHGEFTTRDVEQVRVLVNAYALTFPVLLAGCSANTLICALSKNRILIPINGVLVFANIVGSIILMKWLGLLGIALASSLSYAVSLLLMNIYLRTGVMLISDREWLQIGKPFLYLGGAAIVPFAMSIRVTMDFRASDVAIASVLLGAFSFLALKSNETLIRASVSHTSRSD